VRLRPVEAAASRAGDARRGAHLLRNVRLRRRPGLHHAGPGLHGGAARRPGARPRPGPALLRPVRPLRRQRHPRRVRPVLPPVAPRRGADRRARSGDARTRLLRRGHRAVRGRAHGRVHRPLPPVLAVPLFPDLQPDRGEPAHLPHRHPAHPDLLRLARLAALLRPRRHGADRLLEHRVPDGERPQGAGAARHHPRPVPAHPHHAPGAGGDAGGAADRLHQVRPCPRPRRPFGELRPRAEEHAGAGHHHRRPTIRLHHRLRHRHGNGVPVARHGVAVHPERGRRRHTGDGRLPAADRAGVRHDQPGGGPALLRCGPAPPSRPRRFRAGHL
ncbi:MAG: ABC transporter, permease protein 1 (cluster 5, nickel/peptides/opines), partial [uncultured Acetobacteraceae bacterium]